MTLTGRTVLITGGSSGIGLALAARLLACGNVVIVTGRDEAALAAAQQQVPGLHTVRSDVADPEQIRTLYDTVIAQFPRLDIVVNNAGVMRNLALTEDRTLEDVTREIDINLAGSIRMVQQFLPHLLRQPQAMIVNVSSGLAFVPLTIAPVYSAAKAAIHAYTRCLRVQLSRTKVRVVELAPPGTETPLFRGEFAEAMASQKAMPVATLVDRAIAGINSGKTEIRPGVSNVLKIASRLAPGFMFAQLSKVGRT